MGWGSVANGPIEVVELDMNAHAMLVEPFVEQLAATLNERLQRILPEQERVSGESSHATRQLEIAGHR